LAEELVAANHSCGRGKTVAGSVAARSGAEESREWGSQQLLHRSISNLFSHFKNYQHDSPKLTSPVGSKLNWTVFLLKKLTYLIIILLWKHHDISPCRDNLKKIISPTITQYRPALVMWKHMI